MPTRPPGSGWAACCQCPGPRSRLTDPAAACGPGRRQAGCSDGGGPAPGSPPCPAARCRRRRRWMSKKRRRKRRKSWKRRRLR